LKTADRRKAVRGFKSHPRRLPCQSGRSIHRWAPSEGRASRSDITPLLAETRPMKKRLLITGLVLAALLLALYGVIFGTGD
jgi:hypothetical protein